MLKMVHREMIDFMLHHRTFTQILHFVKYYCDNRSSPPKRQNNTDETEVMYMWVTQFFLVSRAAQAFTMDTIAATAFGLELNSQKDPDNPFVKMGKKAFDFSIFNPFFK